MTITKNQIDLNQGEDEQGRKFGYVAGEDGGLFFTWHDSLEETIASLDADELAGDGGVCIADAAEFLRAYLPGTEAGRSQWETV